MTLPRFRVRTAARRDLANHADYLLVEAGAEVALRFVANARESFAALASQPRMGPMVQSRNPRLAGIRKWRVKGFPKFLIFYVPEPDFIRIVRVLHSAADWWAILDIE